MVNKLILDIEKTVSVDSGNDEQTYSIYFVDAQSNVAIGLINTSFEACGYIEREIRKNR